MVKALNNSWVLVVVLGGTSLGCSTPKMQVPPEIAAGSEVLEVADRSAWSGALADESFKLGPYAIKEVDRDWNSSSGSSIGPFSTEKATTGYRFGFEAKGTKLAGMCASSKKENEVSLGGGMSLEFQFAKLACSCEEGGKVATVVVEGKGEKINGELSTSAGKYKIASIHEVEGGMSQGGPSGYRVDGEKPIGAADVIRPGRAYLAKSLDAGEKAELGCLFAGLMLYMPPKDD